jgi:hypothetical protein
MDCYVDDDIVAALKARLAKAAAKGWGTPTPSDCDAWQRWQRGGTAMPARKRRERKPTLAAALKQASKAGVDVKGATLAADGSVSLTFGKPSPVKHNSWDDLEETGTRQ